MKNALILAAGLAVAAPAAFAADSMVFDIDSISCRALLRMSPEDRDFTLIYMHGYKAGSAGTRKADVDAIAKLTDTVLDSCIGHPDDMVVSVFEAK
ncbi:HdeA/HdeB family chaperone [Chachezhania sediminis]|uniref:HdeA/HdeB family chaperone n=1 Tax=Chachezhania sediminis TaxID=2599291 RepID=UPI00131D56D7|nr:HdeA/HdeB family chaperone [Chachezhania sediminis]